MTARLRAVACNTGTQNQGRAGRRLKWLVATASRSLLWLNRLPGKIIGMRVISITGT
jgi:hypothetical protein